MPRKWTRRRHDALIADVFAARRDLTGLAEEHELRPDQLAAWIQDDKNRQVLAGLCLLADMQTQLMLSRYRQVAVTELIKQASGGDDEQPVSMEQARKACVDLLKADLKRAEVDVVADAPAADDREAWREIESIRAALFGDEDVDEPAEMTPGGETDFQQDAASALRFADEAGEADVGDDGGDLSSEARMSKGSEVLGVTRVRGEERSRLNDCGAVSDDGVGNDLKDDDGSEADGCPVEAGDKVRGERTFGERGES